jgi:hypothetical protein
LVLVAIKVIILEEIFQSRYYSRSAIEPYNYLRLDSPVFIVGFYNFVKLNLETYYPTRDIRNCPISSHLKFGPISVFKQLSIPKYEVNNDPMAIPGDIKEHERFMREAINMVYL